MIGLLTLGTSPREDLENVVKPIIHEGKFILKGALDNLTESEIQSLCKEPGSYPLFVRTQYGSFTIQREALLPLLTKKAQDMAEAGVKFIILLCSGDFQAIPTTIPTMIPARVLEGAAKSVSRSGEIGIVVPVAEQIPAAEERWRKAGFKPILMEANPTTVQVEDIIKGFEGEIIEQIVLDCIGFSPSLQEGINKKIGKPVWLPLTIAARAVMDLFPEIQDS